MRPNLYGLRLLLLFFAFLALSSTACMKAYIKSLGGDTDQVFERIFFTDFNTAWQSTLDALKAVPLEISNREGGAILTKWVENTSEKNFTDSFGGADSYIKSEYRFQVSVAKGFFNGRPSVKITVQKEQLIQRDVLEGWRPTESDSIEENTLLYRIGRLILVKMKLAKIEEEESKKALEDTKF